MAPASERRCLAATAAVLLLALGGEAYQVHTQAPPGTCGGLCGLKEASASTGCRALSAAECIGSYQVKGSAAIPCVLACNGCMTDGKYLLSCPNLEGQCGTSPAPAPRVSKCEDLCSMSDLGGGSCTGAALADEQTCSRSFIRRGRAAVPCTWTGCGCFHDGDDLLDCPDLATLCGKGPVAPAPMPTPPPVMPVPTPMPAVTPMPNPMPTIAPSPMTGGPKCWSPIPKGRNPFEGETYYVNPSYRDLLQSSIDTADGAVKQTLEKMQNVPSAFWIDVKTKIRKGNGHPDLSTVEGILEDAAKCDPPHLVVFMVYDLPNRDCWALASNGEICCHYGEDKGRTKCEMGSNGFYKEFPGRCDDGLREYKETYIDPFAEVVKSFDGKVPVVLILEPDSLPNMITNMKDSRPDEFRGCHDETKAAYMEGIKHAVDKFSETDAVLYLDAGHGGWLGWANSDDDQTGQFAALIRDMGIASKLRGFATNVANYQPVGEILCPAPGTCRGTFGKDDPCCKEDPCGLQGEWNWAHNELNYVDVLDSKMRAAIPGFEPKFVIDTGRNGKPDARTSCSNWCNPRGNGVGHVPSTATPDPRIDALYWLKTPGESDGCTSELPDGSSCPRFDRMCESSDSIGSLASEPRAPEAGLWFDYQIKQLAENADLGDQWWVSLYQGGLQCRAADGGCAPPLPTYPPTPAPTLPPGKCSGNDGRCDGKTSRKDCYAAASACDWTGCCGGPACKAKDYNGWMCGSIGDEASCNANSNCDWVTD